MYCVYSRMLITVAGLVYSRICLWSTHLSDAHMNHTNTYTPEWSH